MRWTPSNSAPRADCHRAATLRAKSVAAASDLFVLSSMTKRLKLPGSIGPDTRLVNDGAVLPVIRDDLVAEVIAIEMAEIVAECGHALPDLGKLDHVAHAASDAPDDLRRRLGRSRDPEPVRSVEF